MLGPVFRTHEPGRDRLVAVKVFRLDITPEQARDLARELDKLAGLDLDHPAIIKPLAGGVEGTVAFLAQEYVAADSLDVEYRQSVPSIPELIQLTGVLASAMDFAAFAGALHGAFHPRDVLITDSEPRVTGFGVAQALERIGVRVPARRPYSAPERLSGGSWDRTADVFALAAVTCELMFGRRLPGDPAQAPESVAAITDPDQAGLREVFSRALALDSASRFPTALAFAEALGEAVTARGVTAAPPAALQSAVDVLTAAEEASALDDFDAADRSAPKLDLAQRVPTEDRSAPILESAEIQGAAAGGPSLGAPILDQGAADEEGSTLRLTEEAALAVDESLDPTVRLAGPSSVSAASDVVAEPADEVPIAGPAVVPTDQRQSSWPLVITFLAGLGVGGIGGYQLAKPGAEVAEAEPAATETRPEPQPLAVNQPVAPGRRDDVLLPAAGAVTAARLDPSSSDSSRPGRVATAATQRAPAKRGRILVRSTPSGAQVLVNGKPRGVTPMTVSGLTFGAHSIRVARSGYQPVDRRVTVSPTRSSANLQVALSASRRPAPETSRFLGSLVIISKPPGASVYLDGRLVGQSPLTVPNVGAGSHAVRLELAGYRRWSSSVRVVAGQRGRVTASLDRGAVQ